MVVGSDPRGWLRPSSIDNSPVEILLSKPTNCLAGYPLHVTRAANSTPRSVLGGIEEIVRFGFSGTVGSSVFALLYLALHATAPVPRRAAEAFAWGLAYFITSWLTHGLHRKITFRWPTSYWRTLRRTYVIYGVSLLLTTVLHDQLVHVCGLDHWLSFAMSLAVSGTCNYLVFRHWGFRPSASPSA